MFVLIEKAFFGLLISIELRSKKWMAKNGKKENDCVRCEYDDIPYTIASSA